ncbi:hypothetical protein GCM10027590_44430 [Nocardiopsis nanhaiensis]
MHQPVDHLVHLDQGTRVPVGCAVAEGERDRAHPVPQARSASGSESVLGSRTQPQVRPLHVAPQGMQECDPGGAFGQRLRVPSGTAGAAVTG